MATRITLKDEYGRKPEDDELALLRGHLNVPKIREDFVDKNDPDHLLHYLRPSSQELPSGQEPPSGPYSSDGSSYTFSSNPSWQDLIPYNNAPLLPSVHSVPSIPYSEYFTPRALEMGNNQTGLLTPYDVDSTSSRSVPSAQTRHLTPYSVESTPSIPSSTSTSEVVRRSIEKRNARKYKVDQRKFWEDVLTSYEPSTATSASSGTSSSYLTPSAKGLRNKSARDYFDSEF